MYVLRYLFLSIFDLLNYQFNLFDYTFSLFSILVFVIIAGFCLSLLFNFIGG